MRIALVVHDFQLGVGQGRYVHELARRFAPDHDVHVFANRHDPSAADGVRVHHVPASRRNALSTVLSFVLPATARVGRAWDIVHAQGLTCLRFNVITAHICNARWARAQRVAGIARTWRQAAFECVVTPLEEATYRFSRGAEAIAISHNVEADLATHYGRTSRVTVIHHGVDTEAFSPGARSRLRHAARAELGLRDDAFAALFVGDLRKGAETAIEAAARVPGLRLIVVSRSDATPYIARSNALGLGERVMFRAATDAIDRYYAAADTFVFPSPYDAFGMVVSEAMAMGLPVITSRQAGVSELITPNVSGLVADAWDVDAIAAALRTLMADRAVRGEMGAAGRAAVARHSWDGVARQTMDVYQRAPALG